MTPPDPNSVTDTAVEAAALAYSHCLPEGFSTSIDGIAAALTAALPHLVPKAEADAFKKGWDAARSQVVALGGRLP